MGFSQELALESHEFLIALLIFETYFFTFGFSLKDFFSVDLRVMNLIFECLKTLLFHIHVCVTVELGIEF